MPTSEYQRLAAQRELKRVLARREDEQEAARLGRSLQRKKCERCGAPLTGHRAHMDSSFTTCGEC